MRRRTRHTLKKSARKHALFAIALGVLVLVIILGLVLSPKTEGGGTWYFPQVHSE